MNKLILILIINRSVTQIGTLILLIISSYYYNKNGLIDYTYYTTYTIIFSEIIWCSASIYAYSVSLNLNEIIIKFKKNIKESLIILLILLVLNIIFNSNNNLEMAVLFSAWLLGLTTFLVNIVRINDRSVLEDIIYYLIIPNVISVIIAYYSSFLWGKFGMIFNLILIPNMIILIGAIPLLKKLIKNNGEVNEKIFNITEMKKRLSVLLTNLLWIVAISFPIILLKYISVNVNADEIFAYRIKAYIFLIIYFVDLKTSPYLKESMVKNSLKLFLTNNKNIFNFYKVILLLLSVCIFFYGNDILSLLFNDVLNNAIRYIIPYILLFCYILHINNGSNILMILGKFKLVKDIFIIWFIIYVLSMITFVIIKIEYLYYIDLVSIVILFSILKYFSNSEINKLIRNEK